MTPDASCTAFAETRCTQVPSVSTPVFLCREHVLQVSVAVVPGLLSRLLAETRSRNEDGTKPLPPAADHVVSSATAGAMPETQSPYARVRSLSLRDEAMWAETEAEAS